MPSIIIEINSKQICGDEKSNLNMHFLPAQIKGDGDANVDSYFNVYTRQEQGVLTNSLRGYPLQGKTKSVPTNYKALVLQETQKPLDEEADRVLRIKGSFNEFTYWNYDKIPSASDGYNQAMQLLDIVGALSTTITEQDVLKEIETKKSSSK
ncbi:ribonuclease H2 subunit C [Stomoxys calcitrans]|uniref:ribonuclease H2 subunit C n=1 Tax=Stomoxys calcitrans TaxID=35570 RepID=UPI0027E36F3A|nr:ribonuclease H2 subunit C [Stomoxys calcitrans]